MILPHLATRLYGAPLMIHRLKLDTILGVLGPRIGLSGVDSAFDLPIDAPSVANTSPGIALIPVHGTLARRTVGLQAQSGLTSYDSVDSQFAATLADPDIAAIVLDIDS